MARRSVGVLAAALIAVLSGALGYSTTAVAPAAAAQTDPAANVSLPQSLLNTQYTDCRAQPIDNSAPCTQALLAEIDYGRATEGLAPVTLPSNWAGLSVPEQVFVIVDLERVARGLQPFLGLSFIWDAVAQTGAGDYEDPPAPQGYPWEGTEWAGGVANPLQADFVWMYNDGYGSPNIDCESAGAPGCWIHRNNILAVGSCATCLVGAGYATVDGFSSVAAVFVEPSGAAPPLAFTWANNVAPYLGAPAPPAVPSGERQLPGGHGRIPGSGQRRRHLRHGRPLRRLHGGHATQRARRGHGRRPVDRRLLGGRVRRRSVRLPRPLLRLDGGPAARRPHRGHRRRPLQRGLLGSGQ